MWAQLISMRLKPGGEAGLTEVIEGLRAVEQPDSGLLRSTTMRDQNDPSRVFTLVVFESEEQARARESDPRRQEGLQAVRSVMSETFESGAEFVDLTVIDDATTQ
jgi:heme-degrading monooxygenase HmoA